jgi:hypothetical protein
MVGWEIGDFSGDLPGAVWYSGRCSAYPTWRDNGKNSFHISFQNGKIYGIGSLRSDKHGKVGGNTA